MGEEPLCGYRGQGGRRGGGAGEEGLPPQPVGRPGGRLCPPSPGRAAPGGAEAHLQPGERGAHAGAGGGGPQHGRDSGGSLRWSRLCLKDCSPWEGTHAGAVREELQPVGRTHIGEVCEGLSPMGDTPRWSRV